MIRIEIDTANGSFQQDANGELKRIFDIILNKRERSSIFGLMDVNGNTIGQYLEDNEDNEEYDEYIDEDPYV